MAALEAVAWAASNDPRIARHVAGYTCECCPESVQTSQDQYENTCTLRALAHALVHLATLDEHA